MLVNAIKKTGYAILAGVALTIGSAGLTTSAQAAPLNLSNPVPITEVAPDVEQVKFRSGRGFRGHRGGFRNRSFRRGGHFRGHHRSHGSRKFSRHGNFRGHRFSRHGGHFRGHRSVHRKFHGRRFH